MQSLPEFTAGLLRLSAPSYARATVRALGEREHGLRDIALPETFVSPLEDTSARLLNLAASISVDLPALFADSTAWHKVALHHRRVPDEYLPQSLDAMSVALCEELPQQCHALVERHLQAARDAAMSAPVDLPGHLSKEGALGELAMHFLLAILEGRGDDAVDLFRWELERGRAIDELHDHVLTPVLQEMGRMWLMAEIPVADEHYAAGFIERCLFLMRERLTPPPPDAPQVLTLGVGGNLHDFGLRIVGQRLQAGGLRVHHLGANMPVTDIAWTLHDRDVDLIAISTTLLMQVPSLQGLIAEIRSSLAEQRGSTTALPILVGGPIFGVADELYRRVGADAMARSASEAVQVARQLLSR